MGLEKHQKTISELHIESNDLSVYGHIKYNDKRYQFQLVYSGPDIKDKDIVFDEPTPFEDQWHVILKNMIILQFLI